MKNRLFRLLVVSAASVVVVGCDGGGEAVPEGKNEPKVVEKKEAPAPDVAAEPLGVAPGGGLKELGEMIASGRLTDEGLEMLEEAAEKDPAGTVEWAVTLAPSAHRDTCLEIAFYKWGGADSAAALNFIRGNLRGMDRTLAAASVAEALAEESPEAASAALALIAEPVPRGVVIESIVTAGVAESPQRVSSWALALSNPYERGAAIAALGRVWSEENPQACAAWIASTLKGADRVNAGVELMSNWGANAPREAANWLATQRESEGYVEAGESLADAWSMVDPRAAASWAVEEPDADTRSLLVDAVVMNWVLNEASNTIDWAQGIQDPAVRAGALETAFISLDEESPAALDYWLETHPTHPARDIAQSLREGGEKF